jgi:oxygen-independent coproporphyrinogen-3 oxidase
MTKPGALYIHFPFCVSVCPYCDFVVYAGKDTRGPANRIDALVDALEIEIGLRAVPGSNLGSVYFGGGTPSLMTPAQIERLLAAAERAFTLLPDAEITIEANPGGGERGDLTGFRAAGVNRISIGAQSLDLAELKRLGRRHTPLDIQETVRLARQAAIANVSLDLLYDVPGQTIATWRDTLAGTLALEPDHVSAYALTLDDPDTEDHLPVSRGAAAWRARAATGQDEDRSAAMYEIADDAFAAAGLNWYELSNWARSGKQSRHNLTYWRGGAWEAVGPGAHAFDGAHTRRWNFARLDAFLSALSAGQLPPGDSITADEGTAQAERAMLALRTGSGLVVGEMPEFLAVLDWGLSERLLESTESAVRLTRRGRLLSNELFARLLPAA